MKHGGLTLEQYAGVTAAVAENIALADVLAQEQIDATAWPDAERAWREAIVGAPDLQLQLVQKRRIAEDCLSRKIEPLDADPAAWTGLLSAIALTDDPDALVGALGITMADVGRLGRKWKQKALDPEVAKKLQELAPTAQPPAKVSVGPIQLNPFPWTPAPKPVELGKASTAAPDAPFLDGPIGEPQRHLASFQLKPAAVDFTPPAVAPPPARSSVPVETAWAPSTPASGPSTPFEAPDPGAHGVSLTQYATLVAKLQAPTANRRAVLEGAKLDEAAYAAVSAHYDKVFSKKAMLSLEFTRLLAAAQKALREEALPASSSSAGRTEDMPAVPRAAAARALASAPPPAPSIGPTSAHAPSRSAPSLSVAQYAWVLVTLKKAAPETLPSVLDRLRLTPETRRELDADWAARIRKDSGARHDFKEALGRLLPPDDVERELVAILGPIATGSGTAQLPDALADRARPKAALPFHPAGAPRSEREPIAPDAGLLPLSRYAEVAATIAREGNPVGTLQRVGIDPALWQANVSGYAKQFAERPALRSEFERLVQLWGLAR